MFRDDWTPEDQQAIPRLAQKFNVDLETREGIGPTATSANIERAAGQARLLGSHFSTSVKRLREVASRRGVHHVGNAGSFA